MIGRKNRFHGYGSLKYVYKNGQTVRGPLFAVKAVANPKRKTYRLAVVVSRKVHKSAVVRNRIRRRLYEAARPLEDGLAVPADIVIIVYNESVKDEAWDKLTKQLGKQFKAAGLLAAKKPAR